ncbi:MAG: hypothetical protein HQK81_05860 [Desulfovibrionaceae bacterium]|nr:hypothetical protein [Desulfovibrionaceae bacterium]MBF0513574.1 hypothetical protein [Desulfovibrionaceae bacterium]
MKAKLPYAMLAIGLSVFCWFLVTGRERVETWIKVRVETSGTPDRLDISGLVPSIEARVRGPRGAIQNADRGQLSYSLDLRAVKPGLNELVFSPRAIALPPTLEVLELRPARVEISAERRVSRKFPVEAVFSAPEISDYKLVEKKTEPDMVEVTGPEGALAELGSLRTRPLTWPADPSARFEAQVKLELPGGLEAQPASVLATAQFAPVMREVALEAPLMVTGLAKNKFAVSPDQVRIVLSAPAPLVRQGGLTNRVEAVLAAPAGMARGTYDLSYKVKMPPGCRLIEAKPEKARVTVR